jgi:alpha,alpha-trehalase
MGELHERVKPVMDYIRSEWEATVRSVGRDAHPRLYLPHEFTAPCASDRFQELYYWDTYFTHLGLLRHDRVDLVQSNIRNMFYMIRKYGFVPNSNAVYHLNRSQPPYLSMMVRDLYERTQDRGWIRAAWEPLRSEYDFWMSRRGTSVGLNRHLHEATDHDLTEFYEHTLMKRLGLERTDAKAMRDVASHYVAEAESGHDFTPRFGGRCADYAPIDLNCTLYQYERNFADFSRILSLGEERMWLDRAGERLARLRRYAWNPSLGAFTDYDVVHDEPGGLAHAASFWALAFGLATAGEARSTARLLRRLEREHGVATCEDGPESRRYQWGFPNAWPPVQVMVCRGLARYGYTKEAARIARKYVETVTGRFEATGALWEKYDSVTGEPGGAEYEPARMMGWSAGTFVYLWELLRASLSSSRARPGSDFAPRGSAPPAGRRCP